MASSIHDKQHRTFLSLLFLLAASGTAQATCDVPATCSNTTASFAGEVVFDGLRASWSVDEEPSDVAYYRLVRYDCPDPASCTVAVAIISPVGGCGVTEDYVYEDDPPAPISAWTYSLEVWRTDGSRACSADAVPQ